MYRATEPHNMAHGAYVNTLVCTSGAMSGGIYYNYPGGTITALDPNTSVACPPTAYSPTTCAWRMYYVGIMDSLDYYDAVMAPPRSLVIPCPPWLCP